MIDDIIDSDLLFWDETPEATALFNKMWCKRVKPTEGKLIVLPTMPIDFRKYMECDK